MQVNQQISYNNNLSLNIGPIIGSKDISIPINDNVEVPDSNLISKAIRAVSDIFTDLSYYTILKKASYAIVSRTEKIIEILAKENPSTKEYRFIRIELDRINDFRGKIDFKKIKESGKLEFDDSKGDITWGIKYGLRKIWNASVEYLETRDKIMDYVNSFDVKEDKTKFFNIRTEAELWENRTKAYEYKL